MSELTNNHAPDFSLPDSDGKTWSLKELLAKGPTLIAFYPGDFTPTCTTQLCSYRDRYESLGIQIVGISNDSSEKHAKFKKEYQFPFLLLTDEGHKVAKAFGATSKWLLGYATRANFILNSKGEILFKHVDAIPISHQTVGDLREVLAKLKAEGKLQ